MFGLGCVLVCLGWVGSWVELTNFAKEGRNTASKAEITTILRTHIYCYLIHSWDVGLVGLVAG